MKPVHPHSRLLISLILLMVAMAFLAGSLRLFHKARAAVSPGESFPFVGHPEAAAPLAQGSNFMVDGSSNKVLPVSFQAGTDVSHQGTPVETPASADTGGIIALAIVIVVTILVGAAWGARGSPRHKKSSR